MALPDVIAPGSIPAGSARAPDSPVDIGVPLFASQDDFLSMVDRLLPEWYVQPLKDPGPGYEIYQAYAKMFELVSKSVGRLQVAALISLSHGGNPSTASVEFWRTDLGTGAFTMKAGTLVRASASNRQYILPADVSFGASDYFVAAIVKSLGLGFEYDVPGPRVTADGTRLPGEIDEVILPLQDPIYAEPAIEVRQVADAYGGSPPVLDQLGDDRDLPRLGGEPDQVYKHRIQKLPDTITPAALRRQLDAAFLPRGLRYQLIETWQNSFQSCWNAPLGTITSSTMGVLREGTFAYNDPRTDRWADRWLGEGSRRACFILVTPNLPALEERGMVWNDPGESASDFRSNFGRRAASAWSSPTPDGPRYLSGAYNGVDRLRAQFYGGVWDLLRQIKGGGVKVVIALAGADQTELAPSVSFPPYPISL